METLTTWTPRDCSRANCKPTLTRVYAGRAYAEKKWKGRRADGYYESHRSVKGEDIGEFEVKWRDFPSKVLTLVGEALESGAIHAGYSGDEQLFSALCQFVCMADGSFDAGYWEKGTAKKAKRAEHKLAITPFLHRLVSLGFFAKI